MAMAMKVIIVFFQWDKKNMNHTWGDFLALKTGITRGFFNCGNMA